MKLSILIITFFLLSCSSGASDQAGPRSTAETDNEASIQLTGPWQFYPFILLRPGDTFQNGTDVLLPHLWQANGPAIGFATYRAIVVLPRAFQNTELTVYMPDVYTSYRIWIDGYEFSGNGTVGIAREKVKPEWLPKCFSFQSGTDPVEVIVQVSNFHHHKGGMGKVMMLGKKDSVMKTIRQHTFSGIVLFCALMLMAVYGFFMFVRIRAAGFLFFSLLTLTWAFRSVFSNDYLVLHYFPALTWQALIRVEYITIYLSALFALLFVAELFRQYLSFLFRIVYGFIAFAFTLSTLFTKPIFFTQYVKLYLSFSASLALAVVYLTLRAFVNDSRGAGLLMINLLAGALLFLYVILSYFNSGLFHQLLFDIGFLLLFALATFSVSRFYQIQNIA